MLRDRDSQYTGSCDAVFAAEAMDLLPSAPQAPRRHAHGERAARSGAGFPGHVLIVHEAYAHRVLAEYQEHCTTHRPHRSRDQQASEAREQPAVRHDRVPRGLLRTRVVGGAIHEYRYTA
ncbi:transposase [Streptomyces sp. GD-15H]|uniref:transposase n=1 Tax=Streptomyces sp. GD-15H TaxID=3129112 RepID=UPI00324EE726